MVGYNDFTPFRVSRGQQGFTLIEIIVILVMLGILASVAFPSFRNHVKETQSKNAQLAVAEAKDRLSYRYAMISRTKDHAAIDMKALVSQVNTDAGDYKLFFALSEEAQEVGITAIGVQERGITGQAFGMWRCQDVHREKHR